MKKEKQHIIPRAYLDAFLDINKQLYSIKTKSLYKKKVLKSSKDGVGYVEGYYDTSKIKNYFYDDLGPDHIEKKVNTYYEEKCRKLVSVLTKKPDEVSLDFARQFIELLISFKQRNPQFNNFMTKDIRQRVAKQKVELAIESGFYERFQEYLNGESKESFYGRVHKQMEEYVADETIPMKVQMESLVDLQAGQNGFAKDVMDLLLEGEWFIFESRHRIPFITSDNPGYTFDTNGRVQNLAFDSAVSFHFPLTPSLHFMVMMQNKSPLKDEKKTISYIKCDHRWTRILNLASIPFCCTPG